MKVVKVTQDHVILSCLDCGHELSVIRTSIRRGAAYAPRCPNQDCISHSCPRITEHLPAYRFPLLVDVWRRATHLWEHQSEVVLLLSSLLVCLASLALDSGPLGLFGFLLVLVFLIRRWPTEFPRMRHLQRHEARNEDS
jgi:hypothetical protein